MKLRILVAALLSLSLSLSLTPALAQHSHHHDGQHGGRTAHAGDYHVEMVTKGDLVEVYLEDDNGKPLRATGYKGLAILVAGGKSQRIVLEPADAARLSGKAPVVLSNKAKGVVQVTLPNGKTVQARFD